MVENFIAEAFSLLAIGIIVVGLRLYSRCLSVGFRRLALDDYLMVVAGCLYSAETVAAYVVGAYWKGLANNSMTPEQRATLDQQRLHLDPAAEEWHLRVKGSQNQLFGWLVYTVLLWTLKSCMLIFYSRLTDGVRAMRIRIQVGAVFLAVTFLATFLSILFGCYPVEKHWQINPDPGNRCQPAVSKLQVAVLITLNISTDLYLMSVPLPMIWKSSLVTRKKWVLSIMFCGGFLVMVFGLLRCILILKSGANGASQAGEWSIRESFVAVIVNNLPMLYTLFQLLTRRDPSKDSDPASTPSYQLGSYRTAESGKPGTKKSRREKFRHPLSMPNDTACGSDERIVLDGGEGGGGGGSAVKTEAEGQGYSRGDGGGREGGGKEEGGIRVQTELSVQSSTQEDRAKEAMGHYGFPERKVYNQYNL